MRTVKAQSEPEPRTRAPEHLEHLEHLEHPENLENPENLYEHRRDRIDCLRLPDAFPGEVHRALPPGAHEPCQPELSRRHHGQASRRLRPEHRLHTGLARRASAADGHRRRGLRRVPSMARRGRHRHQPREAGSGKVLRLVLLQHRYREQPDRVVLHRCDGRRRPAVVSRREGLRPGDHRAQRSGRDGPVRRGVPDAGDPVHFRSRPAVRAHGGGSAARRHHRRDDRHRQRL